MSYNKKINDTNIRIGPVRFSYLNVFAPRKNDDGSEGKYQAVAIIPKADTETVKLVKEAIEAAKQAGKSSKWNGKIPANLKLPLRDGDEDHPDDPAFADSYFINCSAKQKPGVRVLEDGAVYKSENPDEVYSGCYGAVTVNFFPYDNSGNKGVGAGLNNLIKTEDGDKLSGGRSADEDFADMGVDPMA